MGKVKIKKKETRIDMTAMSDVTVLLLTFFMLTSTFLQEEPAQVIAPPSISDVKVPIERVATILVSSKVDKKGETQPVVYMELLGTIDSTLMSSEKLRVAVLDKFAEKYNEKYSGNLKFSPEEKAVFAKLTAFGVPAKDLKKLLDPNLKDEDRLKMQKESDGIGIEWSTGKNDTRETEFQLWVQAIELAYNDWFPDDKKDNDDKKEAIMTAKKEIMSDLKNGKGLAIKADQGTPYSVTELVFNNLAMIHKNKFTLVTSLKTGGD